MPPDPRYIKHDFRRLTPTLPPPTLDGQVGVACPACDAGQKTTPLKYIRKLPNAWRVACGIRPPRGQQGHWYRIWSDTQLNHEIVSINAGNWPSVPYDPLLRDPALAPAPVPIFPTPSQQLLNRLFKPQGSSATALASSDPSLVCSGVNGQTGPTHQRKDARKANKLCIYQACASCCQNLSDRPCGAKGHQKPQIEGSSDTLHPFLNRSDSQGTLQTTSSVPTHRRIPLQSAQSGGRIAREFSSAQLARLFDLRAERLQVTTVNNQFDADESKVVNVTAWLAAHEPPMFFSFLAPKWPSFTLEQCQPLISEAALKEGLSDGAGWTRRLSFWEPKLEGWRTVAINIPSRLPFSPRQIFVKGERMKSDDCPRLDQLIYSAYEMEPLGPTGNSVPSTSSIPASDPSPSPKSPEAPCGGGDTPLLPLRERPLLPFGTNSHNDSIPNNTPPASDSMTVRPVKQLPWPDLDSSIGELLDWSKLIENTTVLSAWDVCYGTRYLQKSTTIYRHARWISIVTAKRLTQWLQEQSGASKDVSLRSARKRFHQEYILAGCPPSQSSQSSSARHPSPRKRKMGER
ncbi:hypothetical protein DFH28DRAFT_1086563 [Melampsora americana]|nr:hypothetical protein DFH28DRAFT_1086563 [Melampsora americana]